MWNFKKNRTKYCGAYFLEILLTLNVKIRLKFDLTINRTKINLFSTKLNLNSILNQMQIKGSVNSLQEKYQQFFHTL